MKNEKQGMHNRENVSNRADYSGNNSKDNKTRRALIISIGVCVLCLCVIVSALVLVEWNTVSVDEKADNTVSYEQPDKPEGHKEPDVPMGTVESEVPEEQKQESDEDKAYNDQIKLGYSLIEQENYQEAIVAFDRAIGMDDKKSEGYVGKAEVYSYTEGDDAVRMMVDVLESALKKVDKSVMATGYESLIKKLEQRKAMTMATGLLLETYTLTNGDMLAPEAEKQRRNIIDAYTGILDKAKNGEFGNIPRYSLYDIDKNGIPELLLMNEAARIMYCDVLAYTYAENQALSIGSFMTSGIDDNGLWTIPDKNGVLSIAEDREMVSSEGDYIFREYISRVFVKGTTLESEMIMQKEFGVDDMSPWIKAEEVVSGTQKIEKYELEDYSGVSVAVNKQ